MGNRLSRGYLSNTRDILIVAVSCCRLFLFLPFFLFPCFPFYFPPQYSILDFFPSLLHFFAKFFCDLVDADFLVSLHHAPTTPSPITNRCFVASANVNSPHFVLPRAIKAIEVHSRSRRLAIVKLHLWYMTGVNGQRRQREADGNVGYNLMS